MTDQLPVSLQVRWLTGKGPKFRDYQNAAIEFATGQRFEFRFRPEIEAAPATVQLSWASTNGAEKYQDFWLLRATPKAKELQALCCNELTSHLYFHDDGWRCGQCCPGLPLECVTHESEVSRVIRKAAEDGFFQLTPDEAALFAKSKRPDEERFPTAKIITKNRRGSIVKSV